MRCLCEEGKTPVISKGVSYQKGIFYFLSSMYGVYGWVRVVRKKLPCKRDVL